MLPVASSIAEIMKTLIFWDYSGIIIFCQFLKLVGLTPSSPTIMPGMW